MKYTITNVSKVVSGVTLYQIKALVDFGTVKKDELGGYIEKESNLEQIGNAWVYGNAQVYGDAQVCGDARVYGNTRDPRASARAAWRWRAGAPPRRH